MTEPEPPDDDASAPLDRASDAFLVGRARDGDAAAFAVIVRRYSPLMRAYARRLLSGSAEADDVTQEALLSAWRTLDTLRNPAAVKSWLMTSLTRRAIDAIRARRPAADVDGLPLLDAQAGPEQLAIAAETSATMRDALSTLPEAQRQAWALRHLGERSYAEIAEALGLPQPTVRGLLARARASLMKAYEAAQPGADPGPPAAAPPGGEERREPRPARGRAATARRTTTTEIRA